MKNSCLFILAALTLLSSCATREQAGLPSGQAIGHDTAVTVIGAATGSTVDVLVGTEMDTYDRQQLNHSFERGLSRQGSSWVNPESGNQYTVIPEPAYHDQAHDRVCRRVEIATITGGKPKKMFATACRGKQGSWEIQ